MNPLLSFVALQLGWFACVLGAERGHPLLGPAIVAATLVLHVRAQPAAARAGETIVLAASALVGFLVDSAFLRAGVLVLPDAHFSPLWLVALWPNVAAATAPGGSLNGLARRPLLGVLLGTLSGPLAYDAGSRLGAVGLGHDRLRALSVICVAWAGVLPLFFSIRSRIAERRDERPARSR